MDGPISRLHKQEASAGLGGNESRRLRLRPQQCAHSSLFSKILESKLVLGKTLKSRRTLKKLFNTSTRRRRRSCSQFERLTERLPPPSSSSSRNKQRAPHRRSLCFTAGASARLPQRHYTVYKCSGLASSVLLASTFRDAQRRVGDRVQGSEPETEAEAEAGMERRWRRQDDPEGGDE